MKNLQGEPWGTNSFLSRGERISRKNRGCWSLWRPWWYVQEFWGDCKVSSENWLDVNPWQSFKMCLGAGGPVKHVIPSTAIGFHFPPTLYIHKVITEIKTHSERMGEEVAVRQINKIVEARNVSSSDNWQQGKDETYVRGQSHQEKRPFLPVNPRKAQKLEEMVVWIRSRVACILSPAWVEACISWARLGVNSGIRHHWGPLKSGVEWKPSLIWEPSPASPTQPYGFRQWPPIKRPINIGSWDLVEKQRSLSSGRLYPLTQGFQPAPQSPIIIMSQS